MTSELLRIGFRQFLGENPAHVLLTAVLPRPVLQYVFFVALGGVLAGPAHREFVYVGGPATALMLVAVMVSDVPVNDKWSGTFFRIRSGRPSPFVVLVLRSVPYPVLGIVAVVVCLAVVPPLSLKLELLALLPLYALMAFTTCAAGLAVAMLALGRRAEALVSNLLAYLVLVAGGVFLPPFGGPAVVLPVRNGLAAVHAALDGRPWLGLAVAEALVGLGWLAAAYVILAIQIRRASRSGTDDYD